MKTEHLVELHSCNELTIKFTRADRDGRGLLFEKPELHVSFEGEGHFNAEQIYGIIGERIKEFESMKESA